MTMYGVVPSFNSVTIIYHVNDPYGQLGDVYFRVTDTNDTSKVIRASADIDGTQLTIHGLEQNRRYCVEFMDANGNEAKDIQYFTTTGLSATLRVEQVSVSGVTFFLSSPEDQQFTSGKIRLYYGTEENDYDEMDVDVNLASAGGYTGTFLRDIGSSGATITLELADMVYNGSSEPVNAKVSVSNPFYGFTEWSGFLNSYPKVLTWKFTEGSGTDTKTITSGDTNYQVAVVTAEQTQAEANLILAAKNAYAELSDAAKAWAPANLDVTLDVVYQFVAWASGGGG